MKNNIFLILIDSLRSDKIFHENKNLHRPNLDKIISNGLFFPNCISSADATLLSWAGLFTGLHPFKTGIKTKKFNKIDPQIKTLFSYLKNENYDFYGYLPPSAKVIGLFPKFENNDCYDERPLFGKNLENKIITFLKKKHSKPWFFYVHPYNLHFPIMTPDGYHEKKFGINNYEKQISLIDNCLGKILKNIDTSNTTLIISADHGAYFQTITNNDKTINFETKAKYQSFLQNFNSKIPKQMNSSKVKVFSYIERFKNKRRQNQIKNLNLEPHILRGLLHHRSNPERFLFDDLIRVPLLFYGKDIINNLIIRKQVRLIDVLPTILNLIKTDFIEQIDGQSLKPLMEGKAFDEKVAYFESTPLIDIQSDEMIGIRTSEFKYFRSKNEKKPKIFLYDLKNDPYEDHNLCDNDELVKKMENQLIKIVNSKKEKNNKQITNQKDTQNIENVLKKLGYI